MKEKGDYIVYIDESGDHNLKNIDPKYPIILVNFCCFKKTEYLKFVDPALQRFKFNHFGHDQIILHETDIKKNKGPFQILTNDRVFKESFLYDLSKTIEDISFNIVPIVIDKTKLKSKYNKPFNPYHIALRFGIEKLNEFFLKENQEGKEISFVFEKRGKIEDENLEYKFSKICNENEQFGYKKINYNKVNYKFLLADKKSNSSGLQLADLTARPIGLNYLKPLQPNRAYESIVPKIYGYKEFP
jgi:hypothetical protein